MKRKQTNSSNHAKGERFEKLVCEALDEGCEESGGRMTYNTKPKLKLQNGETVIPDFVVTTQTPHEVRRFYVECQNRHRSTKSILHKIQHVRTKHQAKTFIYVYANTLGAELARAFQCEAIETKNLAQFRYFILETASFINYKTSDLQVVRSGKVNTTNSRLPLP